ncbi:hypothetical protein BHM03_00036229 [Ensete ventricosum]|nr:hypothetical protein BHM03_00036229 [Ensete ventricosum]
MSSRLLRYADAGLTTIDMADHYGPAEDLYGIFVNGVRRERPPELLEEIRGLVTFLYGSLCNFYSNGNESLALGRARYLLHVMLTKWVPHPVKMTSSYMRENNSTSLKRMDVTCLDMLQFHWYFLVPLSP